MKLGRRSVFRHRCGELVVLERFESPVERFPSPRGRRSDEWPITPEQQDRIR